MVPCVKQPTAMDGHKARVSLPFILDRQGRASVTRYLQTRLCRTHAMRHWNWYENSSGPKGLPKSV